MSRDFNIEKLKGSENYHTWSFAISNLLEYKGLKEALTTDTASDTLTTTKLSEAKAIVSLCIETCVVVHVRDCKSAKEIWILLKKRYENKGLSRKIGLLRKLISVRFEENNDMQSYINEIMECSQKLTGIGFEIGDEWLAAILLAGLSDSFGPFIMGIEATGGTITTDTIISKLMDSQESEKKNGEALFNKKQGNRNSIFKDKTCYNCGKKGHLAKVCRKPPKADKNSNEKAKANIAEEENAFSAFLCGNKTDQQVWYLDSGASNHMTPFENLLNNKKTTNVNNIMTANNAKMQPKYAGDAVLKLNESDVVIRDILHVPELAVNLLSINKIAERGNTITFNKNGCIVKNSRNEIIINCKPENGVYKVKQGNGMCNVAKGKENAIIWHRRLGHMNVQSMKKMRNGAVNGIDFVDADNEIKSCEVCAKGKHARQPFKSSESSSTEILQLIHSDVIGPMETLSIGGARYVLVFTDDYSRKVSTYFLKTKSEVPDCFIEYKTMMENQTGKKIKCIRFDNGTEYMKLIGYFRKNGILHQTTTPYTPQQNGAAERMNRTLIEKAKCLLFDANLPRNFWAEAVSMATYLTNRSVTSVHKKTPDEMFFGKRVDLSNLKLFGSSVMVRIPKEKRKKWDKNSMKMIFVGYDMKTKGYRCIDKASLKLVISRDVIFIEESTNKMNEITIDCEKNETASDIVGGVEDQSNDSFDDAVDNTDASLDESQHDVDPDYKPPGHVEPAPGARNLRSGAKGHEMQLSNFALFTEPIAAKEIQGRPDKKHWIAAMDEEIKSHQTNGTWTLVKLPAGKNTIKAKWVFKEKRDAQGNIVRYKARLVAKGYSQRYGIDYMETFSPVVRYTSIRVLIAIAVEKEMKIHQMDAVTAFLQGDLDEEIYMAQPEMYDDGTDRVCKLNKAIYGLKQAGRQWNTKLDGALLKFGLNKSKMDPCIYYTGNKSMIVAIYVDDFLIFYQNESCLAQLKSYLSSTFNMKDIGLAKGCIGMNIHQGKDFIELDQCMYIQEILKRFGMEDSKPVGTPSDTSVKLTIQMVNNETSIAGKVPYQEAVGSLLYLTQATRPDIAFAVNDVSRFNENHSMEHWTAVKRIFRYLKGTMNWKLRYTKEKEARLIAYTDSDWASDVDKRRSCTGFVTSISNAAISWNSKRQSTVALSSTEAEYIALSSTVCEIVWLKQFLAEISDNYAKPALIFCDNQSTIKLAESDGFRPRTKHIDIRFHHLRGQLQKRVFELEFLPTAKMTADSLTKAVPKEKTLSCAKSMGLAN